jgi:uncharacterized protein YacL
MLTVATCEVSIDLTICSELQSCNNSLSPTIIAIAAMVILALFAAYICGLHISSGSSVCSDDSASTKHKHKKNKLFSKKTLKKILDILKKLFG